MWNTINRFPNSFMVSNAVTIRSAFATLDRAAADPIATPVAALVAWSAASPIACVVLATRSPAPCGR